MNFTGSDWALIITALTGLLGMLGTQIAQLMATRANGRKLVEVKAAAVETNVKIDDAKVAAVEAKAAAHETKSVIDAVKIQTDGLTAGAVASALALGTAEGNLAGRKEQTAENKESGGGAPFQEATIAIDKAQVTIGNADESVNHIPNKPLK